MLFLNFVCFSCPWRHTDTTLLLSKGSRTAVQSCEAWRAKGKAKATIQKQKYRHPSSGLRSTFFVRLSTTVCTAPKLAIMDSTEANKKPSDLQQCDISFSLLHFRKAVYSLTLKSLGKTSVGCPRTTNRRELSFLKLLSRSSRDWSRNLQRSKKSSYHWPDWLQPKTSEEALHRLQQICITNQTDRTKTKTKQENFLFIPSLSTVMRLLHQPAPKHSYTSSAQQDTRTLQDFFLLSSFLLPCSLRAVSTPCQLLSPHCIICMEKSINHVIHILPWILNRGNFAFDVERYQYNTARIAARIVQVLQFWLRIGKDMAEQCTLTAEKHTLLAHQQEETEHQDLPRQEPSVLRTAADRTADHLAPQRCRDESMPRQSTISSHPKNVKRHLKCCLHLCASILNVASYWSLTSLWNNFICTVFASATISLNSGLFAYPCERHQL